MLRDAMQAILFLFQRLANAEIDLEYSYTQTNDPSKGGNNNGPSQTIL